MFLRAVTLVGGLACAMAFSQFPEYSQQYLQRLSGAVDELSKVVERFDADADGLGLTREQALEDMALSGGMAEARAESMRRVFARYHKLSYDLNVLHPNPPVTRVAFIWRMTDPEVARNAWQDFRPALPVSTEGIGVGMIGFLTGLAVFGSLRIVGRLIFRRGPQTA